MDKQRELSVRKYLDAYLNKKWRLLHNPAPNERFMLIDIRNKEWIMAHHPSAVCSGMSNSCWIRTEILYEIANIFDVDTSSIQRIMRLTMEEITGRKIMFSVIDGYSYSTIVEEMISKYGQQG